MFLAFNKLIWNNWKIFQYVIICLTIYNKKKNVQGYRIVFSFHDTNYTFDLDWIEELIAHKQQIFIFQYQ